MKFLNEVALCREKVPKGRHLAMRGNKHDQYYCTCIFSLCSYDNRGNIPSKNIGNRLVRRAEGGSLTPNWAVGGIVAVKDDKIYSSGDIS